jgi:hypothetical protein
MGSNEAGSTDDGLFRLEALSATFWGWVKEVGGGSPRPTEHPATLPDLGQGRKLASVQHQRAMGRDIIEKALGRGEVVLGGVGLVGGKLANSSEDREV